MSYVILRLRPQNERSFSAADSHFSIEENVIFDKRSSISFAFDSVYNGNCTTGQIYDEYVRQIVDGAIEGFHGTVFAYGQTGSGKTYTMSGTKNDGVIPLAIDHLFNCISSDTSGRQYLLRVSYFEIYCEKITDLLTNGKEYLDVREDQNREAYVEGLTEKMISSAEQILSMLQKGAFSRRVGSTAMNNQSSRSHAVFRLIIESKQPDGGITMSHLNLVDLAGSEKVNQTKAEGQRFKEGVEINLSLSTLNLVIKQITENQPHVNYRSSKLTRILKNSIGGNSKTCIICTISPGDYEQSLSTLRFATTAKRIKNQVKKNEIVPETAMIKRLEAEMKKMESEIERVRLENEQLKSWSISNNTISDLDERKQKLEDIKQLILRGNLLTKAKAESKNRAGNMARKTWAPSRLSGNVSLSPMSPTPLLKAVQFKRGDATAGKRVQFGCLPSIEQVEKSFEEDTDSPEEQGDQFTAVSGGKIEMAQYTPLREKGEKTTNQKLCDLGYTPLQIIEEQQTPQSTKRTPFEVPATPYLIKQWEKVKQMVDKTRSFFEKHPMLEGKELNDICEGLEFHLMENLVCNPAPQSLLPGDTEDADADSLCDDDLNLINLDETCSFPLFGASSKPVTADFSSSGGCFFSPFKDKLDDSLVKAAATSDPICTTDQEVQTDEGVEGNTLLSSTPSTATDQGATCVDVAVGTEDLVSDFTSSEKGSNQIEVTDFEVQVDLMTVSDNFTKEKPSSPAVEAEETDRLRQLVESLQKEISNKDYELAEKEKSRGNDCTVPQQKAEIEKLREELLAFHKEQSESAELMENIVLEKESLEERMGNELDELKKKLEEQKFINQELQEKLIEIEQEKSEEIEQDLHKHEFQLKLDEQREEMLKGFEQERNEMHLKLEDRDEMLRKFEKEREQTEQIHLKQIEQIEQGREKQLEELRKKLEQERDKIVDEREELYRKIEEHVENHHKVEKERDDLQQMLEQEREQLKQTSEACKTLEQEKEEISHRLENCREEISTLDDMLDNASKVYAEAETKVEELTSQLAEMDQIREEKRALEERVKQLEDAQSRFGELDAEIQELHEMREKNKALDERVKELAEKDRNANKRLNQCIQSVLDEKAKLQRSLDYERNRTFDKVAKAKKELREENERLKDGFERLQSEVSRLQQQLDEKTQKCHQLELRIPIGPLTHEESESFEILKNRYTESFEHYMRKKKECLALNKLKEEQQKEIAELKKKLDTKVCRDMMGDFYDDLDSSIIIPIPSTSTASRSDQKRTASSTRAPVEPIDTNANADISFLN